jgi:hypothetical protein
MLNRAVENHSMADDKDKGNADQSREYNLRRYKVFLDERNRLIKSAQDAGKQYAKAILTVSASTLAFSLTLIQYIVPLTASIDKWMLVTSWFLLTLSIVVTVISILFSQDDYLNQGIRLYEAWYDNKEKKNKNSDENISSIARRWLDRAAMVFFALGLFFMILYAATNIL